MDPNQQPQYPAPQPPQQPQQQSVGFNSQQYDFITNPAKPPKKSMLPLPSASGNKPKAFLIYGGLAILFIIIISLLYSVFFGGNKGVDQFKPIAQQQTELIRVATIGKQKASTTAAQNLAEMTVINLTSQQNDLVSYLAKQKVKLSLKYLNQGKNTATDQDLATAETNGRFDDAFTQDIRDGLTKYQGSLKSAYNSAGKNGKAILNAQYSQTGLILSSISATSDQ